MSGAEQGKRWHELIPEEKRAILIRLGHNPDLPPRGVSEGTPPEGFRNWVCEVDGHADPDHTGHCIHCQVELP